MSEEKEVEVTETEIVLDDTALASIVEGVTKGLDAKVEALVADRMKAIEPVIEKGVGAVGPEGDDGGLPNVIINGTNIEKMTPEMRFAKHVKATLNKDFGAKKAFDEFALEARAKAGYNNEGVSSEGGYLVLQPEFEAEIERLLPQYGGMANEVNFVPLAGNSVITNKGTNNVSFTKTNEGAAKPVGKSAFSQSTVALNKYTAILLATTELIEDQAVDFWNDATQQFTYAYNKKIDEMVLTDKGTTSSEKGIINTAGVTLEPTSGAGSTITWNDLLNAKYAVPGEASPDGIYVMHRSTFNTLRQLQGSTTYYQVPEAFKGVGGQITPWGDRVVLSEAMPVNASSFVGTTVGAGVVYGNFKRYAKVYTKAGGLQLDVSNSATVVDNASVTKNLWQDNLVGMKAEFRATFFAKFPEAFCIIGQSPLS